MEEPVDPDVVLSAEEHPFDQEDYDFLRKRFLEPRIYRNEELPGGHTVLRKQEKPPLIDTDQPVFKALKKNIAQLEKEGHHEDIYRLLRELRDIWLVKNRLPPCMQTDQEGAKEIVDLTLDESVIIDVDKYIVDMLLVKVVKRDPDAEASIDQQSLKTPRNKSETNVESDGRESKRQHLDESDNLIEEAKTEQKKRPNWLDSAMNGTYRILFQESSVDNDPILFDDKLDDDKYGGIRLGKVEAMFHENGTQASIVSLDDEPFVWKPIGELSNGKILYESLWEYEWRPCPALLADPAGNAFFANYGISEETGEHDDENPEKNFIEFTVEGTISEYAWDFLDKTCLEQLPDSCLLAHFHTISPGADMEEERPFDSFILCRKEDFDYCLGKILTALAKDK